MNSNKKNGDTGAPGSINFKKYNLGEADGKEACNRQLFSVVAPVYPLVTKLLSFYRDQAWKKKLIRLLPVPSPEKILDLACGNGDITWLLNRRFPRAELWGVDMNPDMLALARYRFYNNSLQQSAPKDKAGGTPEANRVRFLQENMLTLSAPPVYFDLVTGGYALRNAPDLGRALQEIKRVLKPGGTAAFLDFSKPTFKPLQYMQLGLLRLWGRFWGWFFHRNPDIYGYIADSLRYFPDRRKLTQLLTVHGFKNIRTYLLFGGFTSLIIFTT